MSEEARERVDLLWLETQARWPDITRTQFNDTFHAVLDDVANTAAGPLTLDYVAGRLLAEIKRRNGHVEREGVA